MRKALLVAASVLLLGIPAHAQTCSKVVSFAIADASGVHPFMGTGNWIGKWVQNDAKKHPDICFSQSPMQGHANYLVVLSQSSGYLTGFDPVVRTDTNMTTTPVSGRGTVTSNYGEVWNYTYNGQVTTTTTITTEENVPYTINSKTLYVYAYSDGGTIVSQRYHVYSTKSGGDAANSAGYNIGNALGAINARGHMLSLVVKDIESQPVTASKDECDVDEVWRLGRSLGVDDALIAATIKSGGVCWTLSHLRSEAASPVECHGDKADVDKAVSLGQSLGAKDNKITDAIKAHGVCTVLIYLRGEAAERAHRESPPPAPSPPASSEARRSVQSDSYAGVGGGHWISEVSSNGAIITLEDDSLWEINAVDRVDTALWLQVTNITVLKSDSPVGDYKYLLINKDDGEKALAKYLGSQ